MSSCSKSQSPLGWNSRECSEVELGWNSRKCPVRWNSGGLWRNWGGTQGSAQRWNCGGAAVGCGGTAEGWDTERNCTNTCTHLQVEHRNKLYKYKQNQLQNRTNYKTKPITNKTNSKSIQQQIQIQIQTETNYKTKPITKQNQLQNQTNSKCQCCRGMRCDFSTQRC